MNYDKILEELNVIFISVLDNDDIKINGNTTAADYEEWDSLNNILLVVAIEKHFKVKITSADFQSWKNVGEMAKTIETRLNQ